MSDDFVDQLGLAVLPHHIRRMLDCFRPGDTGEPRPAMGAESRPRAPGRAQSMMRLLEAHGPLAVMDIAQRLGLSHPMIINFAKQLIAAGLVAESRGVGDRRVRLLELTEAGRIEAERIRAYHADLEIVYRQLCEEVGVDLLQVSRAVKSSLRDRPIAERVEILHQEREKQDVDVDE